MRGMATSRAPSALSPTPSLKRKLRRDVDDGKL
jgi:hypothetical protein